jgi:hypothetical protein
VARSSCFLASGAAAQRSEDGDDVSYAALVTDGGAWESFAYRRQIGPTEVWFVCASWR